MKKLVYIFLALFLVSCGSSQTATISTGEESISATEVSKPEVSVQSILSNMENGEYMEGELLVKFKAGTSENSSAIHQSMNASVEKRISLVPGLEQVKLPEGISVSDAIVQYMSDPNVEYAEPNYIAHTYSTTPNDTYFGNQWGLHNTGTYAGGSDDADIDAPEAWDIITGSQSVGIAIIDTGIDYNHSDLVGNIWTNNDETDCTDGIDDEGNGYIDDCRGWDFVNSDNDPQDDQGHGTHVAGTVGARGNNSEGVTGVMWRVWLMPLKVLDATGSGSVADIVDAIYYAIEKGAKVINASLGWSGFSISAYDAISSANSAGTLLVAAAGNGSSDGVGDNNDIMPQYPASYNLPNIISVAATDQNDLRVPFSNYGPKSVDVAAPGTYIFNTTPNWWDQYAGYGVVDWFAGTSMAAPHVSGLAGLLFGYHDGAQNSAFTHYQVRSTIMRYVDELPSLQGWIARNGRINAYKALSALLIPTDLTATAESVSATEITASAATPTINLSWTDNATGEDGYDIERKSDGDFAKIASVAANSTAYTDSGLDPLTTYTYRVNASSDIGVSLPSNEAAAKTSSAPEAGEAKDPEHGDGCSLVAGKKTRTVDVLVVLIPAAAIFMAIRRRRRG